MTEFCSSLHCNVLVTIAKTSYRDVSKCAHYVNMPVQYTEIFNGCEMIIFRGTSVIFFIYAQNINCGYTLESPG